MLSAANCIWPVLCILSPASDWHGWLRVWNVGGRAAFAGHHTVAGPFLEHSPRPGKRRNRHEQLSLERLLQGTPSTSAMRHARVGTQKPRSRGVNYPHVHHTHGDRGYGELSLRPPTPHPSKARCTGSELVILLLPLKLLTVRATRKPLWKQRGVYKVFLFLHKESSTILEKLIAYTMSLHHWVAWIYPGWGCSASAPLPWSRHSSSLRRRSQVDATVTLSRPGEGKGLGSIEEGKGVVSPEVRRGSGGSKSNYIWEEEEVGPIPSPSGWKENWPWIGRGMQGL